MRYITYAENGKKNLFKKTEPCSRTTITTECRDKNSPASKGTAANFNQGC